MYLKEKDNEMDWTQALTIIGVFIGGFFYLMVKTDSNQKENNNRFNSLENRLTALEAETKSELRNINQRLTDFQGQVNQRLSTIEGYLVPRKVFHFEESHKNDSEEPKEN